MNRSTFCEIKYMKGMFFQRPGIYLGLVRTPIPKLPPIYPPPPRVLTISSVNSGDPDKMPHNSVFHQCLHHLP